MIWCRYSPESLSTVILNSCLQSYSAPLALQLLDDLRSAAPPLRQTPAALGIPYTAVQSSFKSESTGRLNTEASAGPKHKLSRNDFVRALLCLQVGFKERAAQALLSIPSHALVRMCVRRAHLLYNDEDDDEEEGNHGDNSGPVTIAPLSQTLRHHAPWTLLDIIYQLKPTLPIVHALLHSYEDDSTLKDKKEPHQSLSLYVYIYLFTGCF